MIQITNDIMQSTETFKAQSLITQSIIRKSKREISNGVNIATNLGYEVWEEQAHASFWVRQIVKENVNRVKN